MRVLVLGAGLAGLAAAERLVDHGARVVVVDSFPVPGGRVASFDVPVPVAGLLPGDVVEHGLHAWFQHYHALFGLMERAGLRKPSFTGRGIHFWAPEQGHYVIGGGPGAWLFNALRLPESMRGARGDALAAFSRLIAYLDPALRDPDRTDQETAILLLRRMGVPEQAIDHVFRRCLFSLTSLPFEELSALELLRWMSNVLPDPRIRCVEGGGTAAMCAPIAEHLRLRGVDFRFGVEVKKLGVGADGRAVIELAEAPDRTGVRHVLVPGFRPSPPPNARLFDAVVCALPWERVLAVSGADPTLSSLAAWQGMRKLENVHPFTVRLWFERPIAGAEQAYILSSGTVFDVLRPTPTAPGEGIVLIDALVDDVTTHLPDLGYDHERLVVERDGHRPVEDRVLADLERLYPGQIRGNRVTRRFLHTREGIVACRPGTWRLRPPQYVGLRRLVLAGDYTRQPWGVCMEGAVRSGQLAAASLLAGRQSDTAPWAFEQVAHSVRSIFERV